MSASVYDYIVVGLGTAGSVVAARLSEIPGVSVLAIEAGRDQHLNPEVYTPFFWTDAASINRWAFITAPQAGGTTYTYSRGVQWGGSASHNGMVMSRGNRSVYDRWAELTGDPSWGYDNLLRYFKKLESNRVQGTSDRWHGRNGWLTINRVEPEAVQWDMIGAATRHMPFVRDFNGDPRFAAGIGLLDTSIRNGERSDSAVSLLVPRLQKTPNLTVVSDALVTDLLWDQYALKSGTKKVIGVEYERTAGAVSEKKRAYARCEVILSAGAINTPQLLMLSGIGPKDHLRERGIRVIHDLPGVGSHVLDHMEFAVVHKINQPYLYQRLGPEMSQKLYDAGRVGPYTSNGVAVAYNWFSDVGPRDLMSPDLYVQSFTSPFRDANLERFVPLADPLNPYHLSLIEVAHPEAKSGTIRLRSADPHMAPIIDERLYASDHDLSVIDAGVNLVRKIWAEPQMSKYNPVEIYPGAQYTGPSLKCAAATQSAYGYHISGTAKMGRRDDPAAVVDHELKVIGVEGLRVVDGSIFPTIVSSNSALPIYAVAEKAADMIKITRC